MQRRRKGTSFPKRREKTAGHDVPGIPWKEKWSAVTDRTKRSSEKRTERHSVGFSAWGPVTLLEVVSKQ